MIEADESVISLCLAGLASATPETKAGYAKSAAAAAARGAPPGAGAPQDRPARPARPVLAAPGDVPRRRLGSSEGRAVLLHAIAHIEFNAIDLALDMAARFTSAIEALGLDAAAFMTDWTAIAAEEARHFGLLTDRLAAHGYQYGDFAAHDGLWEAALSTRHDVAARLAIAPLILEARGLDVTPSMIEKLRTHGDAESVAALEIIYHDEIGHVAAGSRWFHEVCKVRGEDPAEAFRRLKAKHFRGDLKPPFNRAARDAAGLPIGFYEPN